MKRTLTTSLALLGAFCAIANSSVSLSHATSAASRTIASAPDTLLQAATELTVSLQTARSVLASPAPGMNQVDSFLARAYQIAIEIEGTVSRMPNPAFVIRNLSRLQLEVTNAGTALHATRASLTTSQVTAWLDVTAKLAIVKFMIESTPVTDIPPPAPVISYEYQGTLMNTPVFFTGFSPSEFMANCKSYVASSRISSVYKMTDAEGNMMQTSSYLTADGICGTALLNARIPALAQYGVSKGRIGPLNYSIHLGLNTQQVVELLDVAVRDQFPNAYKFSFNGVPAQTSSYVNETALRALMLYNIARTGLPVVKTGVMHGYAFNFMGYAAADIQTQCLDYWNRVNPQNIYKIRVNGRDFQTSSYMNATQACMTIMAAQ